MNAVLDWEPPKSIPALRSFFILTSYYHKFIKNFAKIATPLTNLLKKSSRIYKWDETNNVAFKTLKNILVKIGPVLKLPNFDKDFVIHFDASNFTSEGTYPNSFFFYCFHFGTHIWVNEKVRGCVNKCHTNFASSYKYVCQMCFQCTTSVHETYESWMNKFCTISITRSWDVKFVMKYFILFYFAYTWWQWIL